MDGLNAVISAIAATAACRISGDGSCDRNTSLTLLVRLWLPVTALMSST